MRRSVHRLLRCARAAVHRLRCGYYSRLAGGDRDSSACHETITPEQSQERRLNTGSNSVSTVSPMGLSPFSRGRLTLTTAILFKSRRLIQTRQFAAILYDLLAPI
jgi:hypothetical protein